MLISDELSKTLTNVAAVFLSFAVIAGCGNKSDSSDEDESANLPTGSASQNGGQAELPEAPEHILSLFKDSSEMNPALLREGGTQCLPMDSASTFTEAVEPWPAGLKAFLASELAKFPEFDLISGSVEGVYLAKSSYLDIPGVATNGTIAGIMCGIKDETRNAVFINAQFYVNDRQAAGPLEKFQSIMSLVDPHVATEHGDQALFTVIHEIFHAIDQTYYINTQDTAHVAGRNQIFSQSWTDVETSIDPRAEIFALTRKIPQNACIARNFFLAPQTPDELAAAYRQIAEATNFISPYAQSNALEDFADTLSTWYFRSVYNNGLMRTVYREDLTKTPLPSATLVYKFDTKAILRTSTPHREKLCAMVDLVFTGDQQCTNQMIAE